MLNSITPAQKKAMILIGCLVYIVSPLDFLPDVIPGVGVVDDFGVLLFGLKTLFTSTAPKALPPTVIDID